MCESCGVKSTAYTKMVMTIREKFADLISLVSKYKDNRMVLFSPSIINIFEPHFSLRREEVVQ